jgi:hypothetical protein
METAIYFLNLTILAFRLEFGSKAHNNAVWINPNSLNEYPYPSQSSESLGR